MAQEEELLLFDVAFTGSSECAIHSTAQDASQDALSTAACQSPRAELCSPTHTQHCATHASLSQGHIGARRRAAKPQDSSRQRIDYYYGRLRQSRDYRGRRGAQDASVDATRAHARVRAGLVLARSRSVVEKKTAKT